MESKDTFLLMGILTAVLLGFQWVNHSNESDTYKARIQALESQNLTLTMQLTSFREGVLSTK